MRRIAPLLAAFAFLVATSPAAAITYGSPDGNRHPAVGGLIGTFGTETYPYCSGTLISPTVFLTAAHCDISVVEGQVTFDPDWSTDATTPLYTGTYYANPAYKHGQGVPGDLAVVVFADPIAGITPAQLPTLNILDQMKAAGTLNGSTQFTSVGYGGQEPVHEPGSGNFIDFLDKREYSVGSYNALTKGYLRLSQNPAHGDGGTCAGDSGGANFFGAGASETNVLAASTITGDIHCHATNVDQRLDTADARAFLGQYVTLP
ncbi:MAG: trypsin-like serine protease [Actinomycetota bacterium]|nr:trypsin-like serine protease [Actinomycetota bacterium]